MVKTYRGSCLCGAVTFEVDGAVEKFYLCHCRHCRKDTGSAHASNLFFADAELRWLSGESLVRTYVLPSTRHAKSFCGVCGSALPTAGEALVVPAGSLDDENALKPTAHIFVSSKAGWDGKLDSLPSFEKGPG